MLIKERTLKQGAFFIYIAIVTLVRLFELSFPLNRG